MRLLSLLPLLLLPLLQPLLAMEGGERATAMETGTGQRGVRLLLLQFKALLPKEEARRTAAVRARSLGARRWRLRSETVPAPALLLLQRCPRPRTKMRRTLPQLPPSPRSGMPPGAAPTLRRTRPQRATPSTPHSTRAAPLLRASLPLLQAMPSVVPTG
jgi:hypothetical protein